MEMKSELRETAIADVQKTRPLQFFIFFNT